MIELRHNDAQYRTKTGKRTRHNCDRACILGLTKRTEARENSYWMLLIEQKQINYKRLERNLKGETYTS